MTVAHRLILEAIRAGCKSRRQIQRHIDERVGNEVQFVRFAEVVEPLIVAGLVTRNRWGNYHEVRSDA